MAYKAPPKPKSKSKNTITSKGKRLSPAARKKPRKKA